MCARTSTFSARGKSAHAEAVLKWLGDELEKHSAAKGTGGLARTGKAIGWTDICDIYGTMLPVGLKWIDEFLATEKAIAM